MREARVEPGYYEDCHFLLAHIMSSKYASILAFYQVSQLESSYPWNGIGQARVET